MANKERPTLQFNKPPEEVLRQRQTRVNPEELSPEQLAMRQRMEQLKQSRQPLGGAPPVRIPPLDAEPVKGGGSMAQQAAILSNPINPLSPMYDPQLSDIAKKSGLAPLPPEAAHQPGFIQGVGSMYASNQPHLKAQPRTEMTEKDLATRTEQYKPHLSKETVEGLEALKEFQSKATETQTEEQKKVDKVAELEKQVKEGQPSKDFYEEFKDLVTGEQYNLLNNPKRRKEIEDRCEEMDITDIIIHGEVRQDVLVKPGKKPLAITFRSVTAEEDLAVKRMMFGETGGDRYLMDKYVIMQLTLALVSINGEELPTHLNDKRRFDETKFLNKFDKVTQFPLQFIADLGIQYLWFDERVRKLFIGSTETLKNS
jgi:hypothetical protein